MKDQLGTACSGLCIVHCLATPALVAAGGLGAVGGLLASKSFHLAMLAPVLLFAAATGTRDQGCSLWWAWACWSARIFCPMSWRH
tara:strand:+ start:179 stop:433 length:255 start_codon:yes stop_codon:yes gene_type:complete